MGCVWAGFYVRHTRKLHWEGYGGANGDANTRMETTQEFDRIVGAKQRIIKQRKTMGKAIWMEQSKKCLDPTRMSVKKRLEWMLKFLWNWGIGIQCIEILEMSFL